MSEYRLIINRFAEQDILEARDWYNEQKENLGNELIQEIKQTVISIEDNPLQFPEVRKSIRKAIVNRFPYSIFLTSSLNSHLIRKWQIFSG
jgi:plasmid stabilization system protein ParE